MTRQTPRNLAAGLALTLGLAGGVTAQTAPTPLVTPPPGHPRVWLRPGDLPEMKRRLADPFYAKAVKRIDDMAKVDFDGRLTGPTNYDPRIHDIAEACAARYLLLGDETSGRKAVSVMREALPVVTYPERQDITREKGATIHTAAIVYDWCFPMLCVEDRTLFITHMKRIARLTEIGYPPVKQGNVTGHAGEAQLFRDQLTGGIAVYDEDPEMYRLGAPRLFGELIPARNYFYPSGWHHQGSMYGPYRFQWEIQCAWILKRMTGRDFFDPTQGQVPYGGIYSTRGDGWPFLDGDGPVMLKNETRPVWPGIGDLITASYFQDERLMAYALERTRARDRVSDQLLFLLLVDNRVAEKSWKDLPLSRYFQDPAGMLMARTGWDTGSNSRVVAAQMKVAPFRFENHQHLDHGHFQVWYKGLLAGDSGIYQGTTGGYGCEHDLNYHKRTIAHNCITVTDPDEKFHWAGKGEGTALANDGGQNWVGGLGNVELVNLSFLTNATNGYQVARVLGRGFGPDPKSPLFSWMTGDLARAYGKKVVDYTRSFLFMNLKDEMHPGVLVVHDRLQTAHGAFPKKWLFHSPGEPTATKDGFAVDGAWGGHLSASVLWPEPAARKAEVIGGEGRWFWVDGKNYPQSPKGTTPKPEEVENIGWRLELTGDEGKASTRFLVVLQVMDKGTAPLPVTRLEGADHVGLVIADRCVVFPKATGDLTRVSLTLPSAVRHLLVLEASPGSWSVSMGSAAAKVRVNPEEKSLLCEVAGGTVGMSLDR